MSDLNRRKAIKCATAAGLAQRDREHAAGGQSPGRGRARAGPGWPAGRSSAGQAVGDRGEQPCPDFDVHPR